MKEGRAMRSTAVVLGLILIAGLVVMAFAGVPGATAILVTGIAIAGLVIVGTTTGSGRGGSAKSGS